MSSFAGVSFRVVPDGNFYPAPSTNDTGFVEYVAEIQFASRSARNAMMDKRTIITWQRPLGVMVWNGTIEAGFGSSSLTIPASGGVSVTYNAVLVELSDIKGYGRSVVDTHQARARFVIVGDNTK